jgi:hypothetical protein
MAFQGIPLGRAGGVSVVPGGGAAGDTPIKIEGLREFLRDMAKVDDRFNTEIRKASVEVAQLLVDAANMEASTIVRNRQALEVMKGMRAYSDRVPTIKLYEKGGFVSKSYPNRKRKRKVTRGDVFFGAEFGGGSRPTTRQFLRHRGRSGYFFWPTVRKKKNEIATEYLNAIDKVLNFLAER